MKRLTLLLVALMLCCTGYAGQYNSAVSIPFSWMLLDGTGEAITDALPSIAYKRLTDGYWYNWLSETWQATKDASCETTMNDDEAALGFYTWEISAASTEFTDADYVAYASCTAETLFTIFDFAITSVVVDATVVLGDGTTRVFADATDETYQITSDGSTGIDMVFARAYTTADWDANNRSSASVRAVDYTDPNGYWELWLTEDTPYTILFTKQGVMDSYTIEVTP